MIQDGVILNITVDESLRSIMARCYPDWTAVGVEDDDGVVRTYFEPPDSK